MPGVIDVQTTIDWTVFTSNWQQNHCWSFANFHFICHRVHFNGGWDKGRSLAEFGVDAIARTDWQQVWLIDLSHCTIIPQSDEIRGVASGHFVSWHIFVLILNDRKASFVDKFQCNQISNLIMGQKLNTKAKGEGALKAVEFWCLLRNRHASCSDGTLMLHCVLFDMRPFLASISHLGPDSFLLAKLLLRAW